MSRSRMEKLKQLLSRVEQRRAAPRLTAIAGANTGGAAVEARGPAREPHRPAAEPGAHLREVPPPAAQAPKPMTSLEQALNQEAPSSIPPPPPRGEARDITREQAIVEARARSEGEAPVPTSLPPTPEPPELKPPNSTVPPVSAEAVARAGTEVLPPVPARIAPSPAVPYDSAVQVVSSPRIDAPKSFGELLEQSLALRPRS